MPSINLNILNCFEFSCLDTKIFTGHSLLLIDRASKRETKETVEIINLIMNRFSLTIIFEKVFFSLLASNAMGTNFSFRVSLNARQQIRDETIGGVRFQ